MKTLIKFIGLFDTQGRVHGVKLDKGLNLITGKSSTGKSSLIEIFDFCMASSEDTIPHGVIEENATFFFVWVGIKNIDYLLGRDADGKSCYIVDNPEFEDVLNLDQSIFDGHEYLSQDYKIQLGLLFGIDAENTAETAEQLKDKRKGASGRPSVRNMMPFILQHQNLIANKQALFYRFDQKEKRDETIAQFKVFAGFVDANYYALSVEASLLYEKLERLKRQLAKADDDISSTYDKLLEDIEVYKQITGNEILKDLNPTRFKDDPAYFKKERDGLDFFEIKIDTNKLPQKQKYQELEKEENHLMAELRESQIHLEEVNNSIDYINTYKNALEQTPRPEGITVNYSVCPFCHQHTPRTISEANELTKALNSLNNELKGIPSIVRPLHEERLLIQQRIEEIRDRLDSIDKSKAELTEIVEALKKNYSLNKQAYKAIYRISSRIELASNEKIKQLQANIEEVAEELFKKQQVLKAYKVEDKMQLADRAIRQAMEQYRKMIPFESSLNDYSIAFDLKKFELYFTKGFAEYSVKKYLRSIGSGANWLNAHLCLFLALADFFYDQKKSTVPTLLFLDQPSQVYFPAIKDTGNVFSPEENSATSVDDDLKAVNKVFSLLFKFCKDHQDDIQIIVTDHADDLTIEGLDNFESIVKARWRKDGDGLVDMNLINGNKEQSVESVNEEAPAE